MRLQKYLNESYVFMEEKFIKNVENFVFKNEKKHLNYIVKNRSQIPPMFRSPNTLYRGMIVSEEMYNKINENFFILDDFSSWTIDENIAKRFITDAKFKIGNKKGKKVIFKKYLSREVILDIFSYIMYLDSIGKLDEVNFDEITKDSALKEKEVICNKGIKLKKEDIFKVL